MQSIQLSKNAVVLIGRNRAFIICEAVDDEGEGAASLTFELPASNVVAIQKALEIGRNDLILTALETTGRLLNEHLAQILIVVSPS
jgi:hypothetical protein